MSGSRFLTLVEAAGHIARGELSSLALTQDCIASAQARQDELNCFLTLDAQGALDQARRADDARARGESLGPLHGVPLAHKDMFYRAGVRVTCGSKIRADFRPDITATVLQRLSGAGAINLGGLHMSEFASGPTGHNAHYGPCRNPWNTAHITGGSSSGAGAAVAARLIFGALGSDTGGSIRLPAAACGVFGMKGTQTRVSRRGAMGLSFSMDNVGPLARTARDCARLFGVIAGHDPGDPTSSTRAVPDYEAATLAPDIKGLRVGIPRDYFGDCVSDEVRALLEASLEVLESLGARRVPVSLPMADAIGGFGLAVSGCEALALHRQWLRERPDDYGPQVRARYESNLGVSAADYLAMIQARPRIIRTFVREVFRQCDVLHCPVIQGPLPTISESDLGDGPGFEALIGWMTRCTRPINYLALPALSVPAGFTPGQLPAAFQLVGRPFSEAGLFRAGAAYEQAVDWSRRTPPE